jgi:hypothetical protein
MSRPSSPNAEDIRAVHQLTGQCRELGDDARLWRRHLFAGLAALSRAGVVMGGELAGVRAGRTAHTGLTDWGWENGFDRTGWERAMAEFGVQGRAEQLARWVGRGWGARCAWADGG